MLNFGVVSRSDLSAQGYSRLRLNTALDQGDLRRVARGWYAFPRAHPDVIRAVQLGGRVGCVTGCRLHGLWALSDPRIHLIAGDGCTMKPDANALWHPSHEPQSRRAVLPLADCLQHVIYRHDVETALILTESAALKGLISGTDARQLLAGAPGNNKISASYLRLGAASGSETRVRLFFQQRKVPVLSQVMIPGVSCVDLLVGRSLIIECDSEAHHTGEEYERDRRHDLAFRALGYDYMRLSYPQVWRTWEQTQRILTAQVRQRRHLRAVSPLNLPDVG